MNRDIDALQTEVKRPGLVLHRTRVGGGFFEARVGDSQDDPVELGKTPERLLQRLRVCAAARRVGVAAAPSGAAGARV